VLANPWDDLLPDLELALNCRMYKGHRPFETLFIGRAIPSSLFSLPELVEKYDEPSIYGKVCFLTKVFACFLFEYRSVDEDDFIKLNDSLLLEKIFIEKQVNDANAKASSRTAHYYNLRFKASDLVIGQKVFHLSISK
jgi:hypothetical protein